jgi:hypothetical protein
LTRTSIKTTTFIKKGENKDKHQNDNNTQKTKLSEKRLIKTRIKTIIFIKKEE